MNIQQRVGYMVIRIYALLNADLKLSHKIKLTKINGSAGYFTFIHDSTAYTVTITAKEVKDGT